MAGSLKLLFGGLVGDFLRSYFESFRDLPGYKQ